MRETISKSLRFAVLDRDRFRCHYCGRRPPEVQLEIDHVLPISRGGATTMTNLVSACKDCNRGKRGRIYGFNVDEVTNIRDWFQAVTDLGWFKCDICEMTYSGSIRVEGGKCGDLSYLRHEGRRLPRTVREARRLECKGRVRRAE